MMAMTTSNRHTMEERLGSMPGLERERGCEPCVAHDNAGVVAPAGPKSQAAIVSSEPGTAHEGAAFAMRRAVGSSEVRQCCIPSPEALGEDLRVCVSLEAPCLPAASDISATQTREEALTAAEFKDAFVADAEAQEWIVEVLAHVLDFTIKSNSCEHLADRSTAWRPLWRSNSRPSSFSRAITWALIDGWAMPSRRAAAAKEPVSTMATNTCRRRSVKAIIPIVIV